MHLSFLREHTIVLTLLFVLTSAYTVGQTEKSSISEIAKKHMHSFRYKGAFQGKGWQIIKEVAKNHKYFILGEDHGLAEVPLFTKELINHVSYDLFVTEIDSVTASIAMQITTQEEPQIASFHSNNRSALSFYSAREEFELLKAFTKSNTEVWGLDQVSLFSTGIAFRRLNEICNSTKAKELTLKLANRSDELFLEATQTGNYDTLFLFSSTQKVFDNLRQIFRDEAKEAKYILNDIEASWKIYNNIGNANYHTRIRGMKSKLLNYYRRSVINGKQYQKILYKFGAYHVGKAESNFGGYDVGNFVSNIAEGEGEPSYHLMIIGKKGLQNSFLLAEGMETASYDITDEESRLNGLVPLANLVNGKDWGFFNLKPLRKLMEKGKLKIEDSFLRNTIKGYDGLVIIPETTPSSNL